MGAFFIIIFGLFFIIYGIIFISDPEGVLERNEKRRYKEPREPSEHAVTMMPIRGIVLIICGLFFIVLAIIIALN